MKNNEGMLSAELAEMQKTVNRVNEENIIFAEQLVESENSIIELQNTLKEKEDENESLRTELNEMKGKLTNVETQASSLSGLQCSISKLEEFIMRQNADSESQPKTIGRRKHDSDKMDCDLRSKIHELEIKITRMTKLSVSQELQISAKRAEIENLKISHYSELAIFDQEREALSNALDEKDREVAKLKDRLRSFHESNPTMSSAGKNESLFPRGLGRGINVGHKDEWKSLVSDSVNASVNFLNGLRDVANTAKCTQES
mmetsp:Transcript_38088/g.55927  ORF Transcript_38088/g.55927 Transcript_38088/m.55927 type:complete len:259 (-) Transcript_38088:239-1015(-)